MSKRCVLKLAVMVAALGAMSLLQGCDEEEDSFVLGTAWLPVGSMLPAGSPFAARQAAQSGATAGSNLGVGGTGGNQVSVSVVQ